ncbi:MAG: sugar nucleotide-binding protein [Candidatus Omnitrophica bacterium]|nr:sugar nucleotide-binding protein [Candidatus Omnitrophota bacterium]
MESVPIRTDLILNNDISRALSLVRAFGNVVFISESFAQGEKLISETLMYLGNIKPDYQAVKLDIRALLNSGKHKAMASFQSFLNGIKTDEEKNVLIINSLEEIAENFCLISSLCGIIKKKTIPIIAFTNIEGFRKLEKITVLSGSLAFILSERKEIQTKRNKSVLIIGATSLFGNSVYNLFKCEYAKVRGTGFSKASSLNFDKLDVTCEEDVMRYFSANPDFDIIIYVAGEADADAAEKNKERAYALNTDAVSFIAKYQKKCKFVYISSEYVFDGKTGPYASDSLASPINYYGHTKLEGERVSLSGFSDVLVLRLGALYGYNGVNDKKTTVSKIISCLSKTEPLEVDNVQIKHPILLEDAARTLLRLLDYRISGVFQVNGQQGLNKQEMAEQIAAVYSEVTGTNFLFPIIGIAQGQCAGKPLNTHMVNIDTPRTFGEGISFLLKKQRALKQGKQ